MRVNDTTSIKSFRILQNNNELVLEEVGTNFSFKKYFFARTNYSIEIFEDASHFKISENDLMSSIIRHPFPKIKAFIAKGRYVSSCKLQIDKSAMEEIQKSSPCSQKILFLKNSEIQKTFPYYIVTYDNEGYMERINYAGTVDW